MLLRLFPMHFVDEDTQTRATGGTLKFASGFRQASPARRDGLGELSPIRVAEPPCDVMGASGRIRRDSRGLGTSAQGLRLRLAKAPGDPA
jgi:hypothetical protein